MIALAAVLFAATPTTGLMLSSEVGKSGVVVASAHVDALEQELISSKFAVRRLVALQCNGERECLLSIARKADVPAFIAVSIAWGKKQTTIDLEGVRVRDGATVAQLTFALTARIGEPERLKLKPFFDQLAEALNDAPTREDVVLTPPPVEPPPELIATRSRAPELVVGGAALGAGIAAAVLVGVAGGTRAQLESTPDPSPLTRAQADELAAQANGQYSASLALGLSAAALAGVAVVLLLRE